MASSAEKATRDLQVVLWILAHLGFNSRMGCVLSGVVSEDRRTLVESRGSPTHQLAGIDGGIPGRLMFCQSSQRNSHPTLHGQPGGDSVCESPRRNALKELVHTGTGILGVVRAQENHSPCGAHPRQEKRDSGLGVTSHVRLQRLATGSGSLQKGSACLRAILSGPLCELQEHSARGVLQLEARSISRSRGRTLSGVVEPPPIPISTLCTDRQKPTQGQDGQSHSGSFDCTPLASSSMVPNPHKHADSSSHSPSVNLLLDPLGQPHPLITQGHLTLVAWPISGVDSRVRAFLQMQPLSFVPPGGRALQRLTRQHGEDGFIGVTDERLILAQRL